MDNLSLDKFSPKKAELQKLSSQYSNLEIKGIDDRQGYLLVDGARKKLKRKRVEIQKTGKDFRAEAVSFQKAVIGLEKELVEIIEPVEKKLSGMQGEIDIEKEKIKRMELLPERKEKLKAINADIEDDFILMLDDVEFDNFYNKKNAEFLEEKERKIKEEQERIEKEKREEEIRKEAEKQAKKQEAERLELAKKQAEIEKQEIINKAEAEKQAIILEQQRKEVERIAKAEAEKQAEEERIQKEKEEQEKKEKNKKYIKFLADNGWTEKTKNDFYILRNKNQFTLYKKIKSIIIN